MKSSGVTDTALWPSVFTEPLQCIIRHAGTDGDDPNTVPALKVLRKKILKKLKCPETS